MDEINLPIRHESKPYLMIPFPDNATNGDVIKAVFPNIEIIINTETHEVTVDDSVNTYMHFFDLDWWNAPYKRGGEQK